MDDNPIILIDGLYPQRLNDFLDSARGRIWMAEQKKVKIEQVEFLLAGGHTVSGEITEIQLGTLMSVLSMPYDRRIGYIRIDESAVREALIPHSHIVAVRYEKKEEE